MFHSEFLRLIKPLFTLPCDFFQTFQADSKSLCEVFAFGSLTSLITDELLNHRIIGVR